MTRPGRGQNQRQKRERPLASAPTCRSSARSIVMVQRRSWAESKASCAPQISRSAMAHRSRAASLRTLSIDENSQFEGSSRRVENPTDPSASVDAKGPQKKDVTPAPLPSIDTELMDAPKH